MKSRREKGTVFQCLGKRRYATLEYAEAKAKELGEKYEKPLRVYYCGMCGGYHCTSKMKSEFTDT
jgi:hypothetical protein